MTNNDKIICAKVYVAFMEFVQVISFFFFDWGAKCSKNTKGMYRQCKI